jgi:hypothetical protein
MSYTASLAGIGLGTTLSIGNTSSPVGYTTVSELKTLNLTGRVAGTEDVTNFQSTAREFIPTLIDNGTWDFTGNRVGGDTGQAAMETAFTSLSLLPFKIQLVKTTGQSVVGDSFTFNALVLEINYSVGVDRAVTMSGRLKASGVLTKTAGS